jgi:hypothetical protein
MEWIGVERATTSPRESGLIVCLSSPERENRKESADDGRDKSLVVLHEKRLARHDWQPNVRAAAGPYGEGDTGAMVGQALQHLSPLV